MKTKLILGLALAVLFVLAPVVIAHSEAQVLPAGTVITTPDGKVQTLAAVGFLLDRSDMDAATYALKALPVDAATILQLQSVSDGQQKKIDNAHTWDVVIAIGAFAVGVFVDELVRK